MTLIPPVLRGRSEARVAGALTAPMPRLSGYVHGVTATFGPAGWTLRFGATGPSTVVRRLAEAESAARDLVGGCLGLPPGAVRVRIVPDRATVDALRRSAARRPWWRGGPWEV